MRTITKEFQVYTFTEASKELKEKIRDYFYYEFDLYSHCMEERIDSLKKLADLLDGELDYSLSCVADQGEYIKITPKYDELSFDNLCGILGKSCPLTGMCYDHDLIDNLKEDNLNVSTLNLILNSYIDSIHTEYESMLTDEYLQDLCEANKYEFLENGKLY